MKRKYIFNSLIAVCLVIFFYLSNRCALLVRLAVSAKRSINDAVLGIGKSIIENPFYLSLNHIDISVAALALMLLLFFLPFRKRKFRLGEEYGSARWGTKTDIKPFIDPNPDHNIILTQTESLSMAPRMKVTETEDYNRNKNVLVIGGSGSGKTRYFVKPNLLQCYGSYIVTDPKRTLITECGTMLKNNGYRILVLNIKDAKSMKQSMGYNPLAYIHCEADILEFVTALITNTKGEGAQSGEKFWQDAEQLYYCALIGYLMSDDVEPADRNMPGLLNLHHFSEAREDDENYKCPVDLLFDELEAKNPDCFAVRQYRDYKKAAGKTAKGILISCSARLSAFNIQELRDLMSVDELHFDRIGDRKTVLFIITSDTNKTFNFVAAMAYTQLLNQLCRKADSDYGGCFPNPVRFILDEFANIGKIPDFENIISVIRSRNISANIILQSKAQLESVYEKKTDAIIDNCDTLLFLGGKGYKMLDEISKMLGKQTIDQFNDSRSRGSQKSDSTNYQKLGRELLTVDELAVMKRSMCICQITGVRPFKSRKYNLLKHPRYKQLADYDKRNIYKPRWPALDFSTLEGKTFEVVDIDSEAEQVAET